MEEDFDLFQEGLRFKEEDRNIESTCREKGRDGGLHRLDEKIPAKIVKQGQKAILEYANSEISEAKEKWRRGEAIEDDIRKNHIPLKTEYKDGTPLEGRIVEATNSFIRVELDKPSKGHSMINFGHASAMKGKYIFERDYRISQYGYDGAREALRRAYQDALHKPEKELVESLNEQIDSD